MNLSGILVVARPANLAGICVGLAALPGVEVHQTDAATGRIVVVQEAESVGAEVEGLKRIKALPGVILAEMVFHHFEHDTGPFTGIPEGLDELQGLDPSRVPAALREDAMAEAVRESQSMMR